MLCKDVINFDISTSLKYKLKSDQVEHFTRSFFLVFSFIIININAFLVEMLSDVAIAAVFKSRVWQRTFHLEFQCFLIKTRKKCVFRFEGMNLKIFRYNIMLIIIKQIKYNAF